MSSKIIKIETIRSGQPRAYADSFYEANISMKADGALLNGASYYHTMSRDTVLTLTRLFVHDFSDSNEWHVPKLKCCEAIGPTPEMVQESHPKWHPKKESRWHVLIVQPYLD